MEVKAHYRDGRKKPWEARWWIDRKLKSRFFETQRERDSFIKQFNREIKTHGSEVFNFDKDRQRLWQEVERILPSVNPLDLAEFWLEHHENPETLKFSEAADAYLKSLELAGRDEAYRRHTALTMKRFAGACGDCHVALVTNQQVQAFIENNPYGAVTRRHLRTDLATAFKWFRKQKWLQYDPVEAVPVPKVILEEPGILTVAETEALFQANEKEDPEICALLALGAFAGMRSSAIARMDWEELDIEANTILTPAHKTKKNRRQFIEGLPENLSAWLSLASKKTFAITPRQFAKRREKAFQRAGLLVTKEQAKRTGQPAKSPPKNCLRHSFVSYHVALHRDPGHTALLISHKNQNILYEHYLGVTTKEDAARYFAILPN